MVRTSIGPAAVIAYLSASDTEPSISLNRSPAPSSLSVRFVAAIEKGVADFSNLLCLPEKEPGSAMRDTRRITSLCAWASGRI